MSQLKTDGVYFLSTKGPQLRRSPRIIGPPKDQPADCPALRLLSMPGSQLIELRQPEVVVGRHSETDLQLAQPDVSRRHCRIFFADNQWYAEDLGSLNGTMVNGERVQCAPLQCNDVIRIGASLFQVEVESPSDAAENETDERTRSILHSIAERLPGDGISAVTTRRGAG